MASITIFEGPDGGGKTSAAKDFAAATKAHYYHFSAWRHMDNHLSRLFQEAMLPALLCGENVVLDRCWLSEKPYNDAFHKNNVIITDYHRRALERLSMRCNTVVVLCLPEFEVCLDNYNKRRDLEMLTTHKQLADVYAAYEEMATHALNTPLLKHGEVFDFTAQRFPLPMVQYDYTKDGDILTFMRSIPFIYASHPRGEKRTVGNYTADYIIAGSLVKDTQMEQADNLNTFPTISFSANNPFNRISDMLLIDQNLSENMLLWVDTDALDYTISQRVRMGFPPKRIICLDDGAYKVSRQIVDEDTALQSEASVSYFGEHS